MLKKTIIFLMILFKLNLIFSKNKVSIRKGIVIENYFYCYLNRSYFIKQKLTPKAFHNFYLLKTNTLNFIDKSEVRWFEKHILKDVELLTLDDSLPYNTEIALVSKVYGNEILEICMTEEKVYIQKGNNIYFKDNTDTIRKYFIEKAKLPIGFFGKTACY